MKGRGRGGAATTAITAKYNETDSKDSKGRFDNGEGF